MPTKVIKNKVIKEVQPIDLKCICNGDGLFKIRILHDGVYAECSNCNHAISLKEILDYADEYQAATKGE